MTSAFSFLKKLNFLGKKSVPAKNKPAAEKKPENDDSPILSERLALIKKRLGESNDVVIREFNSSNDKVKLALLFIDGLVDKKMVNDNILQPILSNTIVNQYTEKLTPENALE